MSDAVVVHFVTDKDSSYLKQIRPNEGGQHHAGGHTSYGQPMGSEIYQHIIEPGGRRHMDTDAGDAKPAFHGIPHNQFPGRSGAEIHGTFGGGALQVRLSKVITPMTETRRLCGRDCRLRPRKSSRKAV